jgi:hypothetical protein
MEKHFSNDIYSLSGKITDPKLRLINRRYLNPPFIALGHDPIRIKYAAGSASHAGGSIIEVQRDAVLLLQLIRIN